MYDFLTTDVFEFALEHIKIYRKSFIQHIITVALERPTELNILSTVLEVEK